ncbi:MAG: sugar transferase [Planctomycetota bacterium]
MLGAIVASWSRRVSQMIASDQLMLTAREFDREIARERVRSTRRAIPFCIVTIQLDSRTVSASVRARLSRLLQSNLRITDHKGQLNASTYAALLVDTPEMGGRAALDRLTQLIDETGIQATLKLRVHDPDGFDDHDSDDLTGNRRNSDRVPADQRLDRAHDAIACLSGREPSFSEAGHVQVTSEDPMVSPPAARMAVKRAVDIAGASIGLLVTGPVILASMAAIRLTSAGPALFCQTREGKGGQPFTIYKLRTMVIDAERIQSELRVDSHRDGPAFKMRRDPRVTTVGHFLRKSCIDELPQLLNVLKGDMSLVGPRPLPWHESRACSAWHRRRLDLRPGLTCYWQVNKAAAETFDEWMRMDLRYVDQFSLLKDLKLIAQTVTVPVLGRGSD